MTDPIARWREQLALVCEVAQGHDLDTLLTFIGEHIEDEDVRPMLALSAIAYVARIKR